MRASPGEWQRTAAMVRGRGRFSTAPVALLRASLGHDTSGFMRRLEIEVGPEVKSVREIPVESCADLRRQSHVRRWSRLRWGTRLVGAGDAQFVSGCVVGVVEGVEQILLGGGDRHGIQRGNLGCGARLLDGPLGFSGQKGAIAGRVGIALGNRGGDARGAAVGPARRLPAKPPAVAGPPRRLRCAASRSATCSRSASVEELPATLAAVAAMVESNNAEPILLKPELLSCEIV